MEDRSAPVSDGDASALACRIAQRLMALEGAAAAWALELDAADEGYARVAIRVTPDMLNGHGSAHGGMIFALGDSAFAYACNSRNVATVGQHCSIAYLAPVRLGERLVAEAREVSVVGRTGSYDIIIYGEDDRVVAHMQGLSRAVGGAVIDPDINEEIANG